MSDKCLILQGVNISYIHLYYILVFPQWMYVDCNFKNYFYIKYV